DRRPLPGRDADKDSSSMGEAIETKLYNALRLLLGADTSNQDLKSRSVPGSHRGCVECHELRPPLPLPLDIATVESAAIVPVNVPDVWFKNARFKHEAHRALDCAQCHEKADASRTSDDVLVPGIDTCLKCHGPADSNNGSGGASNACTECHRYHVGDGPHHARGGLTSWTSEEFQRGHFSREGTSH